MLTDTSPMPFGKYKGMPLQDVPVSYLHWLWHNITYTSPEIGLLFDYIERSMDGLKMENKDLIWENKRK